MFGLDIELMRFKGRLLQFVASAGLSALLLVSAPSAYAQDAAEQAEDATETEMAVPQQTPPPEPPAILRRGSINDIPNRAKASLVRVASGEGRRLVVASGVVIAPNHVLTVANAVRDDDTIVVQKANSATQLAGELVYEDRAERLAIIRVPALDAPAITLSTTPLESGQEIYSFSLKAASDGTAPVPTVSNGTITNLANVAVNRRTTLRVIRHNAMIDQFGFGAPALNNCGELMGINIQDPELSDRDVRRNEKPEIVVYTLRGSEVERILGAPDLGIPVVKAGSRCPSSAQIQAAANAHQSAVAAHAQNAGNDAVTVIEDMDDKLDDNRTQMIVLGMVLLLILIASAVIIIRSKQKREQLKAAAEGELSVVEEEYTRERERTSRLEAEVALARSEAEAAKAQIKTYPTVYLSGNATTGEPIRLAIKGEVLVQSGVIVGRQPQQGGVAVADPSISRAHARLTMLEGSPFLQIEDMGSTNGSAINDQAMPPNSRVEVGVGDKVTFGGVTLTVDIK